MSDRQVQVEPEHYDFERYVLSKGFIRENPYHYMWQLRARGALPSPRP